MHWKEKIKKYIPDKWYLKRFYKKKIGKSLNLSNPITFNEKLQWLKLYDRRLEYTQMVDKYEAKEYVGRLIGEKYIIPTLGVWEKFDEIDFESLPNQFVLKCTHDSGGLIICKDKQKFDKTLAKEQIEKSLKRNYYWSGREWPYKNIKPRIIAEKFMDDNGSEPADYKVHNFNGVPRVILVCCDRFKDSGLTQDFYSDTWEHLDVKRPEHPNSIKRIEKPAELEEMLELSKILSKDIPFVRTDFYTINNKVYFGELTFYPASGFSAFEPEEYDTIFGNWIKIPDLRINK